MKLRNRFWTGLAVMLGVATGASGATLTSIQTRDPGNAMVLTEAPPGTYVQLHAQKTGAGNCGWRARVYVDDGDMNPNNDVLEWTSPSNGFGNMSFPDLSNEYYTFNQVNDYRVEIDGVQHNGHSACSGSASTTIAIKNPDMGGGDPGGTFGKAFDVGIAHSVLDKIKPKQDIKLDVAKDVADQLFTIPHLTGQFGFTKPGGVVAWLGSGFGNQKGKVHVTFTKWNGGSDTVGLEIIEWTGGMVGTKLPSNMTGFRYQNAQVELETKFGHKSTMSFTLYPIEETKELPASDVHVDKCGDDANFNACGQQWGGPGTIRGWHKNSCTIWFAGCYVDDDDWDKYTTVTLQHDWAITSVNTTKSLSSNQEWIMGPGQPAFGATSWKPQYHWHVSPSDTVEYRTFIDIAGPRGVPYK